MARMNLRGWTLEEKKARKRKQANARKQKQRKQEKDEREMAKKRAMLTPTSPEVVEFVEELRGLKFGDMIEPVAFWERQHRQQLPVDSSVVPIPGESHAAHGQRDEHHRQICLARFFSLDFYARQKSAERKKRFDAEQAKEAKHLGITVYELQRRKKVAAWKMKKEAAQKAREVDRLAQKAAA